MQLLLMWDQRRILLLGEPWRICGRRGGCRRLRVRRPWLLSRSFAPRLKLCVVVVSQAFCCALADLCNAPIACPNVQCSFPSSSVTPMIKQQARESRCSCWRILSSHHGNSGVYLASRESGLTARKITVDPHPRPWLRVHHADQGRS